MHIQEVIQTFIPTSSLIFVKTKCWFGASRGHYGQSTSTFITIWNAWCEKGCTVLLKENVCMWTNELIIHHTFPPENMTDCYRHFPLCAKAVCVGFSDQAEVFSWSGIEMMTTFTRNGGPYKHRHWSTTSLFLSFVSEESEVEAKSQTCLDECVDCEPGGDYSVFLLWVFIYLPILDKEMSNCNILKSPSRVL